MRKVFFFDLDGTLMHTLPDLKDAVNDALKEVAIPLFYEEKDVRAMIGRGPEVLAHKALGIYDKADTFAAFLKAYMPLYHAYQGRHSLPFPGMKEALISLKEKGMRLFVVTNKPDPLAKELISQHFPSLFEGIQGYLPHHPPKPDPWFISSLAKEYNISLKEAVFVGDSLPDAETAEAMSLPFILCTYGYGEYVSPLLKRASKIIDSPKGLLDIL